jgi:hypothetical protein
MKTLLIIFALSLLTGCSTIKEWVPSFNDPNQSAAIITVRQSIERLDCDQPQFTQIIRIRNSLEWFELYSQSAGWRHKDVLRVVAPMKETVEDMVIRTQVRDGSKGYCLLKKGIMQEQAARAAQVILGRF